MSVKLPEIPSHRTLFVPPPRTSLTAPLRTSFPPNTVANHHHGAVLRNRRRFSVHPCRPLQATVTGEEGFADNNLKLYSYWNSSSSFRVRIALNLKGIKYEYKAVDLSKGEQYDPEFLKLNPIGFVPVLVDGDVVVTDSLAIVMYLEDRYPQNPFLPHDIHKRAINFQAANIVYSSIQPFQNLCLMKYIKEKVSPEEAQSWAKSAIEKGFEALEKLLKDHAGRYATGDEVFLADLFLAPQLNSAFKMSNIDMKEFPILAGLHQTYKEIPVFRDALPENQPDAAH